MASLACETDRSGVSGHSDVRKKKGWQPKIVSLVMNDYDYELWFMVMVTVYVHVYS